MLICHRVENAFLLYVVLLHQNHQRLPSFQNRIRILALDRIFNLGQQSAHLLVFHPRDAGRDAIVALTEAGWNATDIVTLSQLISFLSFQIRAGAGLRVLAATR